MPMPVRVLAVLVLGAAVSLMPSSAAHAAGASVSIEDFSFQPGSLTVVPGTTVTWTNHDQTNHSVTSDNGSFDSSDGLCPPAACVTPGSSYSHTFSTPGTYTYHCNIHTYMHGSVTVASTTATTATPPTTARPPQTTRPARTGQTTSTTALPTAAAPSLPSGATVPVPAGASAPETTEATDTSATTSPAGETAAPIKAKHASHTGRTVLIVIAALLALIGGGALVGRLSRDRRVT